MPLYHFVTADLPSNTRAPELDDTNATASLRSDAVWSGIDVSTGGGVTEDLMGLYLAYLAAIGFLPQPGETGQKPLPAINISAFQKAALSEVGGRGGTS